MEMVNKMADCCSTNTEENEVASFCLMFVMNMFRYQHVNARVAAVTLMAF